MYRYTIEDLINKYPILCDCREDIESAFECLADCFAHSHKLLIAGNGGSSADADHIVGELMKGFKNKRPISKDLSNKLFKIDKEVGNELSIKLQQGLPTIALHNHPALNTAFINDVESGGELIYAEQVLSYGQEGDVFLGISTSGNAKNIINATIMAKAKGLKTIALTGKDGGTIKEYADISIIVPCEETFMIQELHLPIYHWLCLMLEERFFG